MHAVGAMSGLVTDPEDMEPAFGHAVAIERLAESWLPLRGPSSSDEERQATKDELMDHLLVMDKALGEKNFLGVSGGCSYADVVALPPVLKLFQHVLGDDVKGHLTNVKAWLDRMVVENAVAAGLGTRLLSILSRVSHALYLFPL
jgi:glutathione S-transferase